MKKRAALLVLVAGCPSNPPGTNPPVLWLAPDQAETAVKLVADQPSPY